MAQNNTTNRNKLLQEPLFPLTGRAAIYTRTQRTQLLSHDIQGEQSRDLVALALEIGYSSEQVVVFEDRFASGKMALLRREAMSKLLHDILEPPPETEPIRAIFVSSENRLFRDANDVDITYFIKTCLEHDVTVITPTSEYNFTNPSHVALFRFICEQAAQTIASRLKAGKQRKQQM